MIGLFHQKLNSANVLDFSHVAIYSWVPNKRTGAFNRTGEKKEPKLINVQCKIIVKRGVALSKLINIHDLIDVQW